MNPSAIITLEIEGLRPMEVERLRAMLHRLITQGILNMKSGQMLLHFDDQGNLGGIDVTKRWSLSQQRREEKALAIDRESARI